MFGSQGFGLCPARRIILLPREAPEGACVGGTGAGGEVEGPRFDFLGVDCGGEGGVGMCEGEEVLGYGWGVSWGGH